MIRHQNQKQQRQNIEDNILKYMNTSNEYKSQFAQNYTNLIKSFKIDHHQIQQFLDSNNISFNKFQLNEQFDYQIERTLPCFNFYSLHVKISHFKLRVNVAKFQYSNLLTTKSDIQGCYSKVYFTVFRGKSLCVKTFPLQREEDFQQIFRKAVKEWTILKICSTLECGPFLQNYLGFDLIVYDDCIQFALQKGDEIKNLNPFEITQLKEELGLMHKFKIVHSDIKPQNIIFSNHFNKPVFIDFGFSQIINESLGSKTLSSFKGTPKYCTKQMLQIILDKRDFIDLYYNDAYSLQQTCKYFRPSIVQQSQSYQVLYEKKDYYKWISQKKAEQTFLFICFQYHYINAKEQKLKQLLKEYLNKNPQNIKNVLQFIKKCANYKFLHRFFNQNLKQFSEFLEYQQILHKIKLGGEALYLCIDKNQQQAKWENEFSAVNLFTPQVRRTNSQINCFQNYLKIIFEIQKLEDSMKCYYVAIVFECVRFDESNIQFSKKIEIAKKMNPLFINYLSQSKTIKSCCLSTSINEKETEQNLQIKQLKVLMRLILTICLNQQPNKWTKKYIFIVFQQLTILNDNYIDIFDALQSFLKQNDVILDSLFIVEQLWQLSKVVQLMKNQPFRQLIHAKLKTIISDFSKKITSKQYSYKKFSIQKCENMPQIYQKRLKQIQNFNNPHAKKRIFQLLIMQAHQHIIYSGKIVQIIKIIQFVKKSPIFYSFTTLMRYIIMIDLMDGAANQSVIQKYFYRIESMINCLLIFANIDYLKYFIFYPQSSKAKIIRLIQKLNDTSLNTLIYPQFLEIIKCFCHLRRIDQDIKNQLILLYQAYKKSRNRINSQNKKKLYLYLEVYQKITIQAFFYKLSSQTTTVFIQSLQQWQSQYKVISQMTLVKQRTQEQIIFAKYKITLSNFNLILVNDKYQKSLYQQSCIYLEQLINIYKKNHFYSFTIGIAKDFVQACFKWQIPQELLVYPITQLFNNSKEFDQIVYLKEFNYLTPTLNIFARYNKQAFIQLLFNLTKFLSSNLFHSTKSYFMNLLRDIDWFIKTDIEYRHLIHYSQFISNQSNKFSSNLQNNPYLLIFYAYSFVHQPNDSKLKLFKIFALNCDLLTNFAREELFQRYYKILIINMRTKSKRRRIYVFREAKNYIGAKLKNKQSNSLFKIGKKLIFTRLLHKKMKILVKK